MCQAAVFNVRISELTSTPLRGPASPGPGSNLAAFVMACATTAVVFSHVLSQSEWAVHSHELVKFKLSWQDGIPVCCTGREIEIRMWAVSWCSSSTGDARSLEVRREILRFTRSSSLLPPTLPPTTITNCRCRVLQTFLISLFPSRTILPSFVFTAISTAPCCRSLLPDPPATTTREHCLSADRPLLQLPKYNTTPIVIFVRFGHPRLDGAGILVRESRAPRSSQEGLARQW